MAGRRASLFSAATRIGGIVSGRDQTAIEQLATFGQLYGMAFQVIDDILDVIATDEQLGKPAGKDMLEGVYSLPVIHTLASPVGSKLRELLLDDGSGEGLAEADRLTAIEIVRNGPGAESARLMAEGCVQRAQTTPALVSANQARHALGDTAQHLLDSVAAAQAA